MVHMDIIEINEYFEKIKTDDNLNDVLLIEKMDNSKKKQIYNYLKSNHALYAGGEICSDDLIKVRNIMIKLWLRADKNNKKYRKLDVDNK